MTEDVSLKYADIERERRFLLPGPPAQVLEARTRHIHDRYIDGTRLRLRLVEEDGAPPVRKMGHKVRLAGPSPLAVAHTSVYLDAAEFAVLAQLPAAELVKTRYGLTVAECQLSVDVFRGPLEGLVLAETEDPVTPPGHLTAELGALAEVTDDDRFSGGRLARTGGEQLRELLATYRDAIRHTAGGSTSS